MLLKRFREEDDGSEEENAICKRIAVEDSILQQKDGLQQTEDVQEGKQGIQMVEEEVQSSAEVGVAGLVLP